MRIISFLFIITLIGCEFDTEDGRRYTNICINNKTKVDIELQGFVKKKLKNTIKIPSNKRFTALYDVYAGTFVGVLATELDSVNVVFDESKQIVEYCGGKNLNFCGSNMVLQANIKSNKTKLFVKNGKKLLKEPLELTYYQSDYDRAVPIKK